jgi:predicted phage terminase large subunit-like protein
MIFAPPGHAKSDTVSVHTPLWVLEAVGDWPIALASYQQEKASEWGAKVRDLIEEHADILTVRLKEDSTAKHRWHTATGRGGMFCAGVCGPLTGYRAMLAIVDDPVKNREEANSPTYRDRAWKWFSEVLMTRLYPQGTAILMMTRWHEDDLAGRILRQQDEAMRAGRQVAEWEVIRLPYIAEDGDVLGRPIGAPLWPEAGYTVDYIDSILQDSYTRAALYQQRPAPESGAIFRKDDFRYYREDGGDLMLFGRDGEEVRRVPRSRCLVAQVCDTAIKTGRSNDWTVVLTFLVTPESDVLVEWVERRKIEVPDQLPLLLAERRRWKPAWQGVEDKASGSGILQTAAKMGSPMRPLKADIDKRARAMPAVAMYENGKVYHRQGAPWLAEYEMELLSFDSGFHDDQVDCIAHAVRSIARRTPQVITL